MEILGAIAPLLPTVIDIIKEAISASKGDDQIAIGILMGILGSTEENRTRAALVVARMKANQEFLA
jgi:hypothetical protein